MKNDILLGIDATEDDTVVAGAKLELKAEASAKLITAPSRNVKFSVTPRAYAALLIEIVEASLVTEIQYAAEFTVGTGTSVKYSYSSDIQALASESLFGVPIPSMINMIAIGHTDRKGFQLIEFLWSRGFDLQVKGRKQRFMIAVKPGEIGGIAVVNHKQAKERVAIRGARVYKRSIHNGSYTRVSAIKEDQTLVYIRPETALHTINGKEVPCFRVSTGFHPFAWLGARKYSVDIAGAFSDKSTHFVCGNEIVEAF